ncbi:MAG: Parallel beta-helix repeat protein [Phycisphaerales bacterium]|nr:Parallel beta-helix repeat protein [Phycisphaerales bacterium]
MFEALDARRLFATITGTLWTDADGSTTFDTGETPLKAATVFIDANANGRYDSGELTMLTDKSGIYQFKDVSAGDYLIGAIAPTGNGQTTPGPNGTVKGSFDIQLTGISTLNATEQRAFNDAATRLESIITGDLPAAGSARNIDDIRIDISVDSIDGDGGTLAEGGPDSTRVASGLPYTGDITFDKADIPTLISEGHLVDTITHEMLHVLGFGTIWSDLGVITGEGTRNPRFTGEAATKEYDALFRSTAGSVPVESKGGDGTADGHWPEASFVEELMTGFSEDAGVVEPLSRITVASLEDIGYTVNLNAADVWDPINHTSTVTTPLDFGGKAFERRVTVAKNDTSANIDFGYRADTAPRLGTITATAATLGESFTLSASNIRDAESDNVIGVSFYGETNGIAGLQGGRGGDLLLGSVDSATNGTWRTTASTAGLAAGQQTIYAVATDALGLSGRGSTVTTLTAPPPPTRPNPVVTTRTSRSTARLQWRDRSTNEIGFRVQLLTDDGTIIQSFNVPADTAAVDLVGLTRGTFYTARVRSYGYGGASAYTRAERFRV